jgi:hypothetical protein
VKKWMLVSALVALIPLVAVADTTPAFVAEFDGGIGVNPISGTNTVRGVAPGGLPWYIGGFRARVRKDGHIFAEGHHLVLAAGNNLGQSLLVSVQAQLFCGAASTTPLTTTTTTLNAFGDFRFDENLPSAPADPCVDPVLLMVIPPTGTGAAHWLAAGVPGTGFAHRRGRRK